MGTTRPSAAPLPSPERIFQTCTAYHQSAGLRAAVEIDLFTAIADGFSTAERIAGRTGASTRGVRILCDYLVVLGFLTKQGDTYRLAQESEIFLNRNSPAYLGTIVEFLQAPMLAGAFDSLTEAVRKGGTALDGQGSMEPENPVWVNFARAMAPMMRMPAEWIAGIVAEENLRPSLRVLDIAAGHGLFGIAAAQRIPRAEVVAVDWPGVLEVARENAAKAGVATRYSVRPGDAFEVDYGADYDVVLLTNFLHHFDQPTCVRLLKKVRAALRPEGRAITLEFVPNEDRVSPPTAASFSLTMLASTPSGDAYTFAEYQRMFAEAGFPRSELLRHPVLPQQVIVSR